MMAVEEQARHDLYDQLVETLGSGHARTLMGLLPSVGWADVATKRDLDALGQVLRLEMEVLGRETTASIHEAVADLRAEINAQTRLLFFSMLTVMLTAVALAFTAARFA
jgi:hypothetical protein